MSAWNLPPGCTQAAIDRELDTDDVLCEHGRGLGCEDCEGAWPVLCMDCRSQCGTSSVEHSTGLCADCEMARVMEDPD